MLNGRGAADHFRSAWFLLVHHPLSSRRVFNKKHLVNRFLESLERDTLRKVKEDMYLIYNDVKNDGISALNDVKKRLFSALRKL